MSILCALLRHCRGQLRQRIVSKFTENDCEKVDRLMELHFKYLDKVGVHLDVHRVARVPR